MEMYLVEMDRKFAVDEPDNVCIQAYMYITVLMHTIPLPYITVHIPPSKIHLAVTRESILGRQD